MTVTFITGANKSLGHETARRLIEHGHTVLIGARDPERGTKAADELGGRFVQIDVTDDASVASAAADVAAHEGHVDVLINNAGVAGTYRDDVETYTAQDAAEVLDVNVVGVVRVTQAFLPLLHASDAPQIVNVTSGLGSFAATQDPDRVEHTVLTPIYSASKAALTMLSTIWARGFHGIRVNVVDPGYTATDFNGNTGTQTVTEGTDAIVEMATTGPDGPTGAYRDRHGVAPF
ncbi:SDR family NAD(P)-dependent oxidoreductase [uncultured Jatrophihabitans sp.]|uniref:SDR family NAD(P)-dependent oxidoreductase n=1 Tax=uncultured Jatrophihabitans sp. TaxID=1610747 RepID=UPI0035CC5C9A